MAHLVGGLLDQPRPMDGARRLRSRLRSLRMDVAFIAARLFNPAIAVPPPMLEGALHDELSAAMRSATTYLEYGSGGSTLLAASLVRGTVLSVESDRAFRDAIAAAVAPADRERVKVLHVDIGPTTRFGRPMLPLYARWSAYPVAPWRALQSPPDLILIDGRFRVACVLTSLLHLPTTWGGVIYLDDYEGGPKQRGYAAIEPFIANAAFVGRALRFTPGAFDRAALGVALATALRDTR